MFLQYLLRTLCMLGVKFLGLFSVFLFECCERFCVVCYSYIFTISFVDQFWWNYQWLVCVFLSFYLYELRHFCFHETQSTLKQSFWLIDCLLRTVVKCSSCHLFCYGRLQLDPYFVPGKNSHTILDCLNSEQPTKKKRICKCGLLCRLSIQCTHWINFFLQYLLMYEDQ